MTELTDKMRTCAAYLTHTVLAQLDDHRIVGTPEEHARGVRDAAALLAEAAALLDDALKRPAEPEMLGEPMPLLPFVAPTDQSAFPKHMISRPAVDDAWVPPGGPLPGIKASGTRAMRSCPKCGSHAYKRVFRRQRDMYLHCGVCAHEWLFAMAVKHA